MQFARLYMGSPYNGVTLYTATSRTLVRSMEAVIGLSDYLNVKINDTGSDSINMVWKVNEYPSGGTYALPNPSFYEATAHWRGAVVLEPGDYLYGYATATSCYLLVCGVTGV